MRIIFARHRHRYDSYYDFWRLVELSGFESCYLDQVEPQADAFYVALTPFNNELWQLAALRNAHPNRACRIAFWNLERPDFPGTSAQEQVSHALQCADRVWVSDQWYQKLDGRQQHVIFGGHAGLCGSGPPLDPRYDYCHMSYVDGRRGPILQTLRASGLSEAPARGPGPDRDQLLRQSRVMVNVHQTAAPVGSFLRFVLAAAYRMPLVSETLAAPYPMVPNLDFVQADTADLPLVVRRVSQDPYMLEMGKNLWQLFCRDHTFRGEVEAAVKQQLEAK